MKFYEILTILDQDFKLYIYWNSSKIEKQHLGLDLDIIGDEILECGIVKKFDNLYN